MGKILNKIIYKIMDPIEALLKPFKINLNAFFTYVFSIIAVCFTFDRLLELFYTLFTGQFVHYWSPLMYTFALFMVVASYEMICASPYNKTITDPLKYYIRYSILFRIICGVMVAQWVNEASWKILMDFSNFRYIAINMPELITPAITSLSMLFPLFLLKWSLDYYINDVIDADQDWIDSFEDFKGYKLVSAKSNIKTPDTYLCNAHICIDDKTGKPALIPENKRFEAILVEGATGTGKTATIVEPMCAMDLERKYFFREVSKKLGYNVLSAGLATLNVPYSNEYLNNTFTLSYLKPNGKKLDTYKDYVKDMLKYEDTTTGELYYRDLGFTLVAPDNNCIERVKKVAAAYDIPVNVIDPSDPNSLGINPFIGTDPAKVASIISTVLKGMYEAENSSGDNVFFANVTQQAFENLAILLKLVYPRMNNGTIPTLEDMLAILNNFDLAEEMTEVLKKDPDLSEDYKSLIGYFEKNFYKPPVNIHGYEIASTYGSGRKETEKFVYGAITQLDNFLRNPGIKRVLCSRDNNIDLDRALREGQVITACTRQGDLGEIHQKAFGMFVILSLKDAVLRRPGIEDTRTPHFIYIDEFPLFVNKDTEAFFTLFRKYRCGTLITIQNLSQLTKNRSLAYFKDVIITNTKTQIIFGDMTKEESEFWSKEMGEKKKWKYKRVLADPSTQEGADKLKQNFMTADIDYTPNYKPGKIFTLGFKTCVYKTKDASGKTIIGRGKTDFIDKKYYEHKKSANYNFDTFTRENPDNSKEETRSFAKTEDMMKSSTPKNPINTYDDSVKLDVKSKPMNDNNDIFIDVNHDGNNDFIVADLPKKSGNTTNTSTSSTSSSKEIDMKNLNTTDNDSIVIGFKK